ncbi:hypothetical protein HFP15_21050 [Amycolatopsis sp. K13G38]|uniref:Uncharacterized protein n=1 Tax=Amycolatopsis acididurans TaxID=2724524 RepID=A0ABX1J6J4_9PSEU|nr:hypothetical protein [Amycolatopsis acididurans]NKQ55378.1 hypothetical protein [Amycolatopsis acididurans]
MRVTTAQLPPMEESADKIFVTPHAVIMLDGASAFVPVPVPASDYADHLGRLLANALTTDPTADPTADLPDILAEAIRSTASHFDLRAGESPSSTVTIARERDDYLDLLVLGDNTVILPGGEILTDDRMDRLNLEPRRKYRERLAAGHGYDDEHRALLRELQTQQAELRNREDGYWIAEADQDAAQHSITLTRDRRSTAWAVLTTDGAYNTMDRVGLTDWSGYASADTSRLGDLLQQCHEWERVRDPSARFLPRAKQHDDKAIATARFTA